jgi:hypothetical protein
MKKMDFDKLDSRDPKVKYGFTKALLKTGAETPGLLYDHFDQWTRMLNSDNNIFRWTAIDIIGYLSSVDKEDKTDKLINNLIAFLHCGNLITCNHAIFALGLIAKNKPERRSEIILELLGITRDNFKSEECRNIAMGKVIEALKDFPETIRGNKKITDFLIRAGKSTRNATARKAEQLLKKISAG